MDKYRVHELVKYNYSDIGEYIDEYHTDRPLRNDILVDKLNEYDGLDTKCSQLEKENEELKKTIKNVCDLLAEEVDIFSDKATEHDICAYVELKELDNKDAYYMATSTKKAIKMLKECFR